MVFYNRETRGELRRALLKAKAVNDVDDDEEEEEEEEEGEVKAKVVNEVDADSKARIGCHDEGSRRAWRTP